MLVSIRTPIAMQLKSTFLDHCLGSISCPTMSETVRRIVHGSEAEQANKALKGRSEEGCCDWS